MRMDEGKTLREESRRMVLGKMMSMSLDALVVTDLPVIRWLTGFSGSSARLLVTRRKSWLFTDFRYMEQAAGEVDAAEVVITARGFMAEIDSGLYPLGETVALQADSVTWHEAARLVALLDGKQRVIPVDTFFEEFRMLKNRIELQKMRRAAEISEKVLEEVLPLISPSVTELDIAAEISYLHRKFGAEKDSFDPIVAGGLRSSMPHAKPTREKIVAGSFVILDFGCIVDGYASDQTRTIALGRVPDEARQVYRIVQEAQSLGIRSVRCGMSGSELDAVVRGFIADRGFGAGFGHGLGHGVGLDVHEAPRISQTGTHLLRENMVFTIEPGVYLPGRFGVRIEDTVLLGPEGAVPFQRFSKELLEL
ncbi:MAG: M24 family metallopeptidase [Chlorobiaceae bacterium]|nr:M24 family metallopeptidase [Chlorobiaceae bacterium]NTV60944.1 M24 family metallopeptidase [Chlorobiaceae bacterium]